MLVVLMAFHLHLEFDNKIFPVMSYDVTGFILLLKIYCVTYLTPKIDLNC